MDIKGIKTISEAIEMAKLYKKRYDYECKEKDRVENELKELHEREKKISQERHEFFLEMIDLRMDKMFLEQQLKTIGVPVVAGRNNKYYAKMEIYRHDNT